MVGAVKYGFVVEIYAVVAALTLVGSWDTFQTARDTLQKEASGLYMLAHAVDTYDGPQFEATRAEMRGAIRAYAGSVVAQDWPAMQAGVPSSGSDSAFQRMTRAFLDVEGTRSASRRCSRRPQTGSARWRRRGSPGCPCSRERCRA